MPEPIKKVMISSTARDLPEHRKQVQEACMRQGMFPMMMEHLPASDADAIVESLRMVDEAEIYLGVFGHRYGYVPVGRDISITEMEYERAVERGIPRLIFLMHEDHSLKAADFEAGAGAEKLAVLKARLKTERVVDFFRSADDLRARVIDSLSRYHQPDLTAFHYVRAIPRPPEPYIAHPYTLLQTQGLVGRQAELNLLTDWIAKRTTSVYHAHILNIVAIGGMGKSALAWHWFNHIAPLEMRSLAGRLWWSFYESDARFENFVIRALAYVSGRTREDIEKNTKPGDREDMLLRVLDREPYLLALDGLERILVAYARMDAARLADDDLDEQTANCVVGALGLPQRITQSPIGQHQLRKTADPRAGNFLRKLAHVRMSRVLVSTRLYPADLQTVTGATQPGSIAVFLTGLSDDDALALWRAFGVSGAREVLLLLFRTFKNHPLLIQALASEVAHDRRTPGDFERWWEARPDFDPFQIPLLRDVQAHVLKFALSDLGEPERKVLQTVSALRMPATYGTIVALLTGESKLCANERVLDAILTDLEDRGLLGWDQHANRYDLHPIVRSVAWDALDANTKQDIYGTLHAHFEALPKIDEDAINSLDDLTPAIELYNTLIGQKRYDDAYKLFSEQLDFATLHRLSVSRIRATLLELLFPDGVEQLPRLSSRSHQALTLNSLASAYRFSGQPKMAIPLLRRHNIIQTEVDIQRNVIIGLNNLASTLYLIGKLYESEAAVRQGLYLLVELNNDFLEAASVGQLGMIRIVRGFVSDTEEALQWALQIFMERHDTQAESATDSYLAQRAIWIGDFVGARALANRAWELVPVRRVERDFIRAARLQGAAALGLNDLTTADERLHHALSRARTVNLVEEELLALVALAELRRRQGDPKAARELLDDVWEPAERGPYPLFHADALNALAQIERDTGNESAAVAAATRAYELAWCDGPPFAYHWGLAAARAHLAALSAPEPALPPFEESKHEPMAEVAIDLPDEE